MQKRRRLIYQINQARHAMMKSMDVGCREALGISVTQLSALMVLKEREHCLMKELADALMLDNSAVTGLAKRMQNKDLIVRSACPTDARASRLSLSNKGLSLLDQGMALLNDINHEMNDGFEDEELEVVSRYLHHITSLFTNRSR